MHRPLYSQLVASYELIEGRDWQSEIRLIRSVLKEHESKSVVDLGCGTGYHVRALTKLGFKATGIDISRQNIRFARAKAAQEKVDARFVLGSYYDYRSAERFDVALCLNWSVPVKDDEVKRFLENTRRLLQPEGLLIFDFERISQIVWEDVGKPIVDSWNQKGQLIVRVSVGHMLSNVLYSRDVYIIYSKRDRPVLPNEKSRYRVAQGSLNSVYVDRSCVRFFSIPEIRRLARKSGFKIIANFMLPRNKYRRSYIVLQRTL
jgi:SAM-dependent methyltransferase